MSRLEQPDRKRAARRLAQVGARRVTGSLLAIHFATMSCAKPSDATTPSDEPGLVSPVDRSSELAPSRRDAGSSSESAPSVGSVGAGGMGPDQGVGTADSTPQIGLGGRSLGGAGGIQGSAGTGSALVGPTGAGGDAKATGDAAGNGGTAGTAGGSAGTGAASAAGGSAGESLGGGVAGASGCVDDGPGCPTFLLPAGETCEGPDDPIAGLRPSCDGLAALTVSNPRWLTDEDGWNPGDTARLTVTLSAEGEFDADASIDTPGLVFAIQSEDPSIVAEARSEWILFGIFPGDSYDHTFLVTADENSMPGSVVHIRVEPSVSYAEVTACDCPDVVVDALTLSFVIE